MTESIIERLRAQKPDRNVVFTAVRELTDEREIMQFAQEYADLLAGQVKEPKTPMQSALEDIGYVVSTTNPATRKIWEEVFEGLPHPYFGRVANLASLDGEKSYAIAQADFIINPPKFT